MGAPRQAAVGPRIADLVVQVRLRSGERGLLVLHIEVQGRREADFPARMFTYYALIHLRLWRQRRQAGGAGGKLPLILGVAVLTDAQGSWQPGPYEARGFGLGIRYDYRVLRLRDPEVGAAALATPDNPFALIARLWPDLRATGARQAAATEAVRAALLAMRAGRYSDAHLAAILAFIEGATSLPLARYRELIDEVLATEGAAMAQVMSYIERKGWRRGREEGRSEGRQEFLLQLVQRAVGPLDAEVTAHIRTLDDTALLDLADATRTFSSWDDLDRWLTDRGA